MRAVIDTASRRSLSSRSVRKLRTRRGTTTPMASNPHANATTVSRASRRRSDIVGATSGSAALGRAQAVAHAAHGADQRGRLTGVDLAAQVGDVRLDDVALAAEVV